MKKKRIIWGCVSLNTEIALIPQPPLRQLEALKRYGFSNPTNLVKIKKIWSKTKNSLNYTHDYGVPTMLPLNVLRGIDPEKPYLEITDGKNIVGLYFGDNLPEVLSKIEGLPPHTSPLN